MGFIIIALLILWVITLLGWLTESIYRKLVIKNIKERIDNNIGWLEKKHGDYPREIETFKKAKKIIEEVSKG